MGGGANIMLYKKNEILKEIKEYCEQSGIELTMSTKLSYRPFKDKVMLWKKLDLEEGLPIDDCENIGELIDHIQISRIFQIVKKIILKSNLYFYHHSTSV